MACGDTATKRNMCLNALFACYRNECDHTHFSKPHDVVLVAVELVITMKFKADTVTIQNLQQSPGTAGIAVAKPCL